MEGKVLEILDSATYIPVVAFKLTSDVPEERRHLRRCGFTNDIPLIAVMRINDLQTKYAPYCWNTPGRTMEKAHEYIEDHFDELKSGDVIDVEYILGETSIPKESDCL